MKKQQTITVTNTWDFSDEIQYKTKTIKWINKEIVIQISEANNDPEWMLELRLKALEIFFSKSLPSWWPNLDALDLNDIYYYAKPEW